MRAVYSETLYTHDAFGWAPLRGLREGAYKYIEAPRAELYNLAADPHELNNRIASEPAKAQALRVKLRRVLASHAPKQPASPAAVSPRTHGLSFRRSAKGRLRSGPEGPATRIPVV